MIRLTIAACAALTFAAPAMAANRFATPHPGAGADCSAGAPCGLAQAWNNAGTGDDITILPGDYGSPANRFSAGLFVNQRIDAHGLAGAPRPRLFSSATSPVEIVAGSTLRHLEIDGSFNGGAPSLAVDSSLAEDVTARANGNANACSVWGTGTLRNATCLAVNAAGGIALREGATARPIPDAKIRNVTALAPHGLGIEAGSTTGRPIKVSLVNSIVFGGDGANENRLSASNADAELHLSHSNIRQVARSQSNGTVSLIDDGGNLRTVLPAFEADGVHQAAGSPTIDAGLDDALNGAADLDGEARLQGAATDIGADEFTVAVAQDGAAADAGAGGPGQQFARVAGFGASPNVSLRNGKARVRKGKVRLVLRNDNGFAVTAGVKLRGARSTVQLPPHTTAAVTVALGRRTLATIGDHGLRATATASLRDPAGATRTLTAKLLLKGA